MKNNIVYNIQGFFNEKGAFGSREGVIMAKLRTENKLGGGTSDGWERDPYDLNYNKGFLSNLAENKDYDKMFPNHPLSECRSILNYLIDED